VIPQDPAVAVLGGAVHFAYDPSVIWGRRSKYTYGFGCAMPFRDGVDPVDKRFTDDEGVVRCDRRFRVMVRRGDLVPVDRVVDANLGVTRRDVRTFDISLFATFSDDPQYTDEEGCERVGTVTADVSGSVNLPSTERRLDIYYAFGGSEIAVETRDRVSDARRKAAITFTELYGRHGKAGG
jgi:hypothetical protein